MRYLITGLLIVSLASFASAQTGLAAKPEYAVISVIHWDWIQPGPQFPLITIGCIKTQTPINFGMGAWNYAYYSSFSDSHIGFGFMETPNAEAFRGVTTSPLPAPIEGQPLVLTLVSPIGHTSLTTSALRAGNTLILRVKDWQPNPMQPNPRLDPSAHSEIVRVRQLIYLPPLSAGNYQFQVQWQVMSPSGSGCDWICSDYKVGEIPLKIAKLNSSPEGNVLSPTISFDALMSQDMPTQAPEMQEQRPVEVTARRISRDSDAQPELMIGNSDYAAFSLALARVSKASSIHKLDLPASSDQTYAYILGGKIKAGEWASIDSIMWEGTSATINCDVWTDSIERTSNFIVSPLLVVALTPPASKPPLVPLTPPGHYKITVVWHHLLAPSAGDWYATVPGSNETTSTTFDVH
ncbi:MAG TPA: hypothetical protein VKJ65_14620 [Phycisphaerae bacterium]|nr:hypothetical protein [Phycisphaerae bacterium]